MKNKKLLADLEIIAERTTLPTYNHDFDRVVKHLQSLIDDNFGYAIAKSLIYDEDTQAFWVTVEKSGPIRQAEKTPICLCVQRHVTINVKLPLLPQFEDIQSAIDEVTETYNNLYTYQQAKNARN